MEAQPGSEIKQACRSKIITKIMSSLEAGPLIDFRVEGVQVCLENIPGQAPTCPRRDGSSNYSADPPPHTDTETMIS